MQVMSLLRTRVRWRIEFLANARCVPLSTAEKLAHVTALSRRRSMHRLLLKRIRRAPDGERFFEIAGDKLFFRSPYPIVNEEEMLRGAMLVIEEVYVRAPEFFFGNVRAGQGDTVIDLGGHIGTSALLFSRLVGPSGRVFSFEPVLHAALERNMRENGATNVRVLPVGAGNGEGETAFFLSDRGVDSRIAGNSGMSDGVEVSLPVTTLDRFVAEERLDRVDFIKMDIEGAEEAAIRGAQATIARFRPKWSIASYHTDPSGERQHPKLVRLLTSLGYHVRELGAYRIYAW